MPNIDEPNNKISVQGEDENGEIRSVRVSPEGLLENKSNDFVTRELTIDEVTKEIPPNSVDQSITQEVPPGSSVKVIQATGDIANEIDTPKLLNTNQTNGTSTQTISNTFDIKPGSSRVILVGVSFEDTEENGVQSVTIGGKALSSLERLRQGSPPDQYLEGEGFFLTDADFPADGSQTLEVTMEKTTPSIVANVGEFANVEQRSPQRLITNTVADGVSNSISTDVTIDSLKTFVIDLYADAGSSSAIATGDNNIVAANSANHSQADSTIVTNQDVVFSYDTGDGSDLRQVNIIATFLPERGDIIPNDTRGFQLAAPDPDTGQEDILVKDISSPGDSPNLAQDVIIDNTDSDTPQDVVLQLFHDSTDGVIMTGTLITQEIE
jgi:hypothetical protein